MAEMDIDKIVETVVNRVLAQKKGPALDLSPDTETRAVSINEKDDVKRVAMGSDHRGFEAKKMLTVFLESIGYRVTDVGTDSAEQVDYPDFAAKVARQVATGGCDRGIMIDEDGIGSAIICNKIKGIRAAACHDIRTVVNSRERANANVLTMAGSFHGGSELCEMAKLWLELRFSGGDRWSTVNKLMNIERPQGEERL